MDFPGNNIYGMRVDFLSKKNIKRYVYRLNNLKSNNSSLITKFLTPVENIILMKYIDLNTSLKSVAIGGYERKILIISQSSEILKRIEEDRYFTVFSSPITPSSSITHRDVLGSLMALDLPRDEIGDIVCEDDHIYFVCTKGQTDFILSTLTEIKNERVSFKETVFSSFPQLAPCLTKQIYLTSLRLDVFICSVLHVSRKKALDYLNHGDVKLNYILEKNPSQRLVVGSTISISKFGKFRLDSIEGLNKKNKFIINYIQF